MVELSRWRGGLAMAVGFLWHSQSSFYSYGSQINPVDTPRELVSDSTTHPEIPFRELGSDFRGHCS
jgi:hypothetical protein